MPINLNAASSIADCHPIRSRVPCVSCNAGSKSKPQVNWYSPYSHP